MSNWELWERHRTPPKDACKSFNRPGGFRGTAIDPMWLILEATREWGPVGSQWGFKVINESVERYSESRVLHTCRIAVWYPGYDTPSTDGFGWIESYGNTWLVSENRYGTVYDDEASKKSTTDALSKALSWLGFGADVHMGIFDGNKYADLFSDAPVTTKSSDTDTKQQVEVTNKPWLENIPDDIKDMVMTNIETATEKYGKERYKKWHDTVLSNFFQSDSIKALDKEGFAKLAYYQNRFIQDGEEEE